MRPMSMKQKTLYTAGSAAITGTAFGLQPGSNATLQFIWSCGASTGAAVFNLMVSNDTAAGYYSTYAAYSLNLAVTKDSDFATIPPDYKNYRLDIASVNITGATLTVHMGYRGA